MKTFLNGHNLTFHNNVISERLERGLSDHDYVEVYFRLFSVNMVYGLSENRKLRPVLNLRIPSNRTS